MAFAALARAWLLVLGLCCGLIASCALGVRAAAVGGGALNPGDGGAVLVNADEREGGGRRLAPCATPGCFGQFTGTHAARGVPLRVVLSYLQASALRATGWAVCVLCRQWAQLASLWVLPWF
jgi:hypothetical protein